MYFTTFDAKRTAYMVLEMADSTDIPSFTRNRCSAGSK